MLSRDVENYMKQYTDSLNAREQKEIELIEQKEIEDIKFELEEDSDVYKMNLFITGAILLMAFKIEGKYFIKSSYEEPSVFIAIAQILLWIAVAVAIFTCVMYPIIMKNIPNPSVRGGVLHHKGKGYHYKQLTMIKLSSMNRLTVYEGRKKILTISKSYLNYGSLIAWGRKCGIMIYHEPPMDQSKVRVIMLIIILIILFLSVGGITLKYI